jgi:hypothetical protein
MPRWSARPVPQGHPDPGADRCHRAHLQRPRQPRRTDDKDQGIAPDRDNASNIAPLDANGLAYSRTAGEVLNIVYLTGWRVTQGGFFPAGVNGTIRTSAGQLSPQRATEAVMIDNDT